MRKHKGLILTGIGLLISVVGGIVDSMNNRAMIREEVEEQLKELMDAAVEEDQQNIQAM